MAYIYKMSYQYDPSQCAQPDTNDDQHFQQIEKDLQNVTSIVPATAGFFWYLFTTLLPIILAVLLVYFVVGKFTLGNVIITAILAMMIYIIINNMTGSNLPGSLPPATYPIPPHLGLDGVSLENRTCLSC